MARVAAANGRRTGIGTVRDGRQSAAGGYRCIPVAAAFTALLLALTPLAAPADDTPIDVAVIVPVTGPLALEGQSQRNGAVLALQQAKIPGVELRWRVLDAGAAPENAVNAFMRGIDKDTDIVVASLFGPHMLAMLPLAEEAKVPLLTVSGTARVTELGSPWVFRFFPSDREAKLAQARYAVETVKARKVALVTQTTAYGQSGRENLTAALTARSVVIAVDEQLTLTVRDMAPVLQAIEEAAPDAVLLQLHSAPTALFLRQWADRSSGKRPPVIAGSALHQPATAALLQPAELAGSCAETASSPASAEGGPLKVFSDTYRKAFAAEPDAFAAAQYDGMRMALAAVGRGAHDGPAIAAALAKDHFGGIAMGYESDGEGNMASDVVIVCYDGRSRQPAIAAQFRGIGREGKNRH